MKYNRIALNYHIVLQEELQTKIQGPKNSKIAVTYKMLAIKDDIAQ